MQTIQDKYKMGHVRRIKAKDTRTIITDEIETKFEI